MSNNKKNSKVNGIENILNDQQQRMREQVVDLEMKARYWKANFEIMDYSLKSEAINEDYKQLVALQEERNKKAEEEYKANMERIQKEIAEGTLKTDDGVPPPEGLVPSGSEIETLEEKVA